ncbi:hypothetical protein T4B_6070 [Trichinella pseudospiralis]|uniref:Uncharacterized protein n=1 Tax=Trichinella pseudospiralis TaxID=6337 RepID=A0A0V1IT95_TRIPS|nr:hypothetical protein T4B_6070 [Trichinella pseudospiralis]KRZ37866.1 hypothetical protein T4C_7471 [Trichinella pseudospiralis]
MEPLLRSVSCNHCNIPLSFMSLLRLLYVLVNTFTVFFTNITKGINSVSRHLYVETAVPGASICFDCSLDPSISASTLKRSGSRTRSLNSLYFLYHLEQPCPCYSVVMEWVHHDHEEQALQREEISLFLRHFRNCSTHVWQAICGAQDLS